MFVCILVKMPTFCCDIYRSCVISHYFPSHCLPCIHTYAFNIQKFRSLFLQLFLVFPFMSFLSVLTKSGIQDTILHNNHLLFSVPFSEVHFLTLYLRKTLFYFQFHFLCILNRLLKLWNLHKYLQTRCSKQTEYWLRIWACCTSLCFIFS